jgi:hypothetical protein
MLKRCDFTFFFLEADRELLGHGLMLNLGSLQFVADAYKFLLRLIELLLRGRVQLVKSLVFDLQLRHIHPSDTRERNESFGSREQVFQKGIASSKSNLNEARAIAVTAGSTC